MSTVQKIGPILQRSIPQEAFRGCKRMLFHLAVDPSIHVGIIMVYWIFDLIQFLSFPFNMEPNFMWYKNSVMRLVMSILAPIMIVPTGPEASSVDVSATSADSLYFASVAFLIVLWGSFIWGAYYHIQPPVSALDAALAGKPINGGNGAKHSGIDGRDFSTDNSNTGISSTADTIVPYDNLMIPYWVLRFIRTITFVGTQALFIPITTTLVSPFYCPTKAYWPLSSHKYLCYDPGHLGFVIASVILFPLWIGWNIIVAACVINRIPDLSGKRNILCASHGRVFAGIIVLKALLSGLFVFSAEFNSWVYCIIVLVSGLAYVFLYWHYLPYFHQWINQVQLSIGCVFTTAAISLLVAQIIGDPSNYAGVASCLALFIPAIYVGYALGSLRFRSFAHHSDLFSPFAVELRMRFLISELISQLGNANEAIVALTRSRTDTLYTDTRGQDTSTKKGNSTDEDHNVDEEKTLLRKNDVTTMLSATLENIEVLFKEAVGVFSTSAILQLFYAQFVGTYRHNEHLERIFLRFAETRADQLSFDIQFFVQQRRMELRTNISSDGNRKMNIERRMQFESLQELSRVQVSETRNLILSFWTELSNKNPDLTRLQKVGITINKAIADTRLTFQELLNVAPQSASDMRVYADFLLELANDPVRAVELLNDAEQLEDERSKAHGAVSNADLMFGNLVNEFDLSSESLAWCKVSADPTKLGIIVDVNPSMLKLFGYNRREMIGREMSFLVPEPIGSLHPRIMQRYQTTGKERIVNQSRSLLALHRNGYIFPIKINIRPTAEEFITAFEEIPSNLAFMFFLGADNGWKVTAACKTSLSAFHFSVSQMRNGTVSLKNFTTDITATMAPLMGTSDQCTVTLGDVRMKARLQITPIACLNTPLYILRYRIIGYKTMSSNESYIDAKHGIDHEDHEPDLNHQEIEDTDSNAPDSNSSVDDEGSEKEDMTNNDISGSVQQSRTRGKFTPYSNSVHHTIGPVSSTKSPPEKKLSPFLASPTKRSVPSSMSKSHLAKPLGHPEVGFDDDIALCPVMGGKGTGKTPTDHTVNTTLPGQPMGVNSSWLTFGTDTEGLISPPPNPPSLLTTNIKEDDSQQSFKDINDFAYDGSENENKTTTSKEGTESVDKSNTPSSHDPALPYTPSKQSSIARSLDSHSDTRVLRTNGTTINSGNDTTIPLSPKTKKDCSASSSLNARHSSSVPNDGSGNSENVHDRRSSDDFRNSSINNYNNSTNINSDSNEEPKHVDHDNSNNINNATGNARFSVKKPQASVKMGGTIVSKGSGMSASTVSDLLRKGVAASGAKLERSLQRLRRSIIVVFLSIAALNLVSLIITTVLFSELKYNLALVAYNGDRALELNRAVGHIQSLVLSAEQKFIIPEGTSYIRNRLNQWVNSLETIHRELYLSVDGITGEAGDLYTHPSIKVYDLVPGTYINRSSWEATERTVGLANGILELVSQIRLVQALSDNNITLDQTPVWYVLYNGMSNLHEAVNRSLMLADERTGGHVARIELANLIVMIIAESTLCVIILCIMLPAVNSVVETKQRVFNTFLEVPVPIIRALRNRVQKKMDAILLAENEEDQAVIDIENEGDGGMLDFTGLEKDKNNTGTSPRSGQGSGTNEYTEKDNKSNNNSGFISPRGGNNGSSVYSYDTNLTRTLQAYNAKLKGGFMSGMNHLDDENDDERTGWARWCSCCSVRKGSVSALPSSVSDIRHHRRRFRNTSSTRIMASILMILPVLCYIIYFAAVFEWRFSASRDVRYIKAEILWSKQAQIFTGLSNLYVRDSVSYCDPVFVAQSLNSTFNAGNHLEFLQNGLMYGSEPMSLRPGIHLDPNVYHLAMVNGCVESNDDSYNMSNCESTFYHGIFGKGFMAGFREYIHINREVAKSIRTTLINDPSLTTLCNPNQRLNSLMVNNVDQMRWRYLRAGLSELTRLRLLLSNRIFDNFLVTNIVISVSTILVLQIFYTTLYKPMIRTMNTEIKNVRLLLLLFPDEVSKQVPAIIAAGKELLSDTVSVTSSSSL